MGLDQYYPIAEKYKVPLVVAGFEPADLVQAIYHAVLQLENGTYLVDNQYARLVKPEGNLKAKEVIHDVFKIGEQEWRGIGKIPDSGYVMTEKYKKYDAGCKFVINSISENKDAKCIAGDILRGIKKPHECPEFNKTCKPSNPLGAPMVSSEGACAAYYHYSL
jgi:hydrogenase expression/formation protein HypD